MLRHRRKLASVVVALTLLFMSRGSGTSVVYAIPCGLNCENITNTPTASVILNGNDQTASYVLTFSLNNTLSLSWHVSITSTQFATGGTPKRTLPTAASSITGVTAVCATGQICTALPQNTVTYPLIVPAGNPAPTGVTFYNDQQTTGIGTFDVSTTIHISVPANAYSGTYTSTITLAFASGP